MYYAIDILKIELKKKMEEFNYIETQYVGSSQKNRQDATLANIKEIQKAINILDPFNDETESGFNFNIENQIKDK